MGMGNTWDVRIPLSKRKWRILTITPYIHAKGSKRNFQKAIICVKI
jgi:hypothetical protein